MKALRNYVRLLGSILVVLGIAAAWFNLLVDPYAIVPAAGITDLDDFRMNAKRTTKAERLSRGGWEALVFGSSVANQTCDPADPVWGGRRLFVAGLPGANLREVRRAFDFALDRNRPRTVVLYVDLVMMSGSRTVLGDFEESRFNPGTREAEYRLSHLLGWASLVDSREVALLSRGWTPAFARIEASGFLRRPAGDVRMEWKDFGGTLRKYFHEEYNRFRWAPDRFDDLRAMLARCRREGIRTVVVLPPFHALALEGMHLMGLWPSFERMKRETLAAVEEAAAHPSAAPAPAFWDFTGYGGPRSEPVPLEGTGTMHWFSDPVHPTATLGTRFLARALERDDLVDPAFREFGTKVDRGNLETLLAAIRLEREAYVRDHAEEVGRLERIHASTAAERARRLRVSGTGTPEGDGE